jgi:hypothetical protein
MLRTRAVSTVTPTAPSAERVGRVVITSGRRIVGAGPLARICAHAHRTRSDLKALWCGATAVAFAFGVSFSPAMAQGLKTSGGNTWLGISQRVDHSASPVPKSPTVARLRVNGLNVAPGILDLPFDPVAAKIKPHYEWQYHYAGPHARWEAHWVRVMAPTQTAPPTVASKPTVPKAQ